MGDIEYANRGAPLEAAAKKQRRRPVNGEPCPVRYGSWLMESCSMYDMSRA